MTTIEHSSPLEEAKLTVKDFIELSGWGMDDEVGHYAYLWKEKRSV